MKDKPCIAIKVGDHLIEQWVKKMSKLLPEFNFRSWHDDPAKESVEYIIGWCPDARWINSFPNLKAAVSVGSGVDHIVHLNELREDIPVIRTVSDDLVQRVREFVALCVLSWHRQFPQILKNNHTGEWKRYTTETSNSYRVGIMGYGTMGKAAAQILSNVGYKVSIWAATSREVSEYDYYWGDEGLAAFAEGLDVLICLLPLTEKTENILDRTLMSRIKRGGCVMNFARGRHLVDEDLFQLIETGHISTAYLDGYREEPLPASSPFFSQDNVIVTFHSAGYISPEIGPKVIAENIRKFERGEKVWPMYDRSKGF